MRRYGSSKRNPNPPWPCEQKAVIVPPGSNATAIGRTDVKDTSVYMPVTEYIHSRNEEYPIMDYSNGLELLDKASKTLGGGCENQGVSTYLCRQTGNYAKVEFLFGDNTHIEKTGVLESVGRDFIVISEVASGALVVCPMKKIKFINLYDREQK